MSRQSTTITITLGGTSEPSNGQPLFVVDQAQVDALYHAAKAASEPCRIVKGDSPEERLRKKTARQAIWEKYDKDVAELKAAVGYQAALLYAIDFFGELERDPMVIGWTWKLGSICTECPTCRSLAGDHEKNVRLPYPAHPGCGCLLSVRRKRTP